MDTYRNRRTRLHLRALPLRARVYRVRSQQSWSVRFCYCYMDFKDQPRSLRPIFYPIQFSNPGDTITRHPLMLETTNGPHRVVFMAES